MTGIHLKMKALFNDHLKERLALLENALDRFKLDGLVLSAGSEGHYYQDDQAFPFTSDKARRRK